MTVVQLLDLPREILVLIAKKLRYIDFYGLCQLRLVCRELSGASESSLFASASFHWAMRYYRSQMEALASGTSPNSRWTTQLRIEALAPGLAEQEPKTQENEYMVELYESQSDYLISAIRALGNLTSASMNLWEGHPFEDALKAFSQLPHLEHLELHFSDRFDELPLSLGGFVNLRTINLFQFHLIDANMSTLKTLLANSPNLEVLSLLPANFSDRRDGSGGSLPESNDIKVSLADLLADVPPLKYLAMDACRIGLPFTLLFTCLTELRMKNAFSPLIDHSFWRALTANGVHLEGLHMSPITRPAIDYLLSYEGLKTLKLYPSTADQGAFSDEDVAQERQRSLFRDVLPRHGPTLQNLLFEELPCAEYGILLTVHTVCDRFEGIRSCFNLETLQIIYYYPDFDDPSIFIRPVAALRSLINGLARSAPRLQHLAIQPKRVDYRWPAGDFTPCHGDYVARHKVVKDFKRDLKRALQKSRVEFTADIEVIEKM